MHEPPGPFEANPAAYVSYLETLEGRLRLDLVWRNLVDRLDGLSGGRGALDAGSGPGHLALRLARLGWQVTLVDASQGLLDTALETARREDLTPRVSIHRAPLADLGRLPLGGDFALALCHNVLEYVDDPAAALRALRSVLPPGARLSLLVRNRGGEVLKAAIKAGDLAAARQALSADTITETLYGSDARLFDPDGIDALLAASGFELERMLGVRVAADYLGPELTSTPARLQQLLEFEWLLGQRAELVGAARYVHAFARAI